MANGSHRHGSRSSRTTCDPPGWNSRELIRRERYSSEGPHRSRNMSHMGLMPSITTKRSSFRGAREKPEQQHDRRTFDSIDASLITAAWTPDDSLFSSAEECQNCCNDKAYIDIATAIECGLHDVENVDGYDTDNAVVYDTFGFSSTKKQRYDQSLVQQIQENVQRVVEQIVLAQTIAINAWNEVALEYHHRVEPFTSLFVPHLLNSKYLAPSFDREHHFLKGKSVLDVAAGTGAGGLYAASRGASSVMATDFSETMLHVLQSRIDAGDINQMETCLANGMSLPLNWCNRYDVVLSNFGVIYFPKVEEGLLEMVRCTKPGGKVCISGWGSKEKTPAFKVFPAAMKLCGFDQRWYCVQKAARKHLLALTSKGRRKKCQGTINLAPNYFCPSARIVSNICSLYSMLANSGLQNVQVVSVEKDLRLDSAESYWDRFVLASPNLKRFVEHCLSPEEVEQLKDTVLELLRKESSKPNLGGGVVLKASAYVAFGTKTWQN